MREGKAKVLDDTEFKRLIRIAGVEKHAERNVAVCMCLWGLGMRVGEVAAIRIQDVLAEDGNVRNHFQVRRRDSKTNTNRDIYLSNPKLRRALKGYIDHRHKTEGPNITAGSFLFRSQKGGGFSPNSLQQMVKRLARKAGLPETVSSHSGRRFFASRVLAAGTDVKSLSALLGHASVRQSISYCDTNPLVLERVAANVI
jgi:integrase/recombinase XerD